MGPKSLSQAMQLTMKALLLFAAALPGLSGLLPAAELEVAATFPERQVTGVAISKAGRMFVNFPFWSDQYDGLAVAEVMTDGSLKPYPNQEWNKKDGPTAKRWVCVQSVYVDAEDMLWVLDPASPKMEGVVPGGAKLAKISLTNNDVERIYGFDDTVVPDKGYLNDVRVERKTQHAFITESGTGAIIVLDLKSGKARRLLANSPLTRAETEEELVVDGFKLIEPKTGMTPRIHADGIALDEQRGILYFHPLTGRTLYRVETSALLNADLDDKALSEKVEKVAQTSPCDGMIIDPQGGVYLTAFEENALQRWDREQGVVTVIKDQRLQWPDSLSWGPEGDLYVTTSQIHRQPKYHGGESRQKGGYHVYRLRLRQSK